jgi:hypothetical protein
MPSCTYGVQRCHKSTLSHVRVCTACVLPHYSNTVKQYYVVDPISGPLYRPYTYTWEREGAAPIWQTSLADNKSCPFSGDPLLSTGVSELEAVIV